MIKTLIFGIVCGIAATIAALYFIPAVNLDRETSIISVLPNGGNAETFTVEIPTDRVVSRGASQPEGLEWPTDAAFADVQAELFKLRDTQNSVIGIASRFAVRDPLQGDVVEWLLHLPARGSLYLRMQPSAESGRRGGVIRAGTREFADLRGEVSERWIAAEGSRGHIELETRFVSVRLEDSAEAEQ